MKRLYIVMGAFIALLMAACTLDGGNLIGPAGGYVFYDKGSYSDGWRYLECAPEDAGTDTWERSKELCEEYSHGGYDDWYLPDIDQLDDLLKGKHGFSFDDGLYWSSSEENAYSAWGIQKDSEEKTEILPPSTYSKSGDHLARPIRSF